MKKLKFLIAFSFVTLLSCNDATDIIQPGEFNEDVAYSSVEDMNLALSGVYNLLNNETAINFTTVFTDECGIGNSNGGQNLDEYRWFLQANSADATSIWTTNYAMINYANRLLRGAALVEPAPEDLAQYDQILAEARALRAFGHFQLLSYFSTDMSDDNALGVMILDYVPQLSDVLPRSTNAECFAFINEDLDFAAANLGNPSNYKYVTQNFITAMRARIGAYRGDYATALTNAQALIDAVPLTLSGVPTNSPYLNMWRDLSQGECIFNMDRPVGKSTIGSTWFFNQPNFSGGAFMDMGRNLFNLLDNLQSDIRYTAFVGNTSLIAADPFTVSDYRNEDVIIINKYPGKAGAPLLNDLKVFRVSEMYFIKAEALASAGNINGATNSVASVLKQVRDARKLSGQPASTLPVYANATEAWADILEERRIELCFEGHRYIDIKRLGQLANATIDRFELDCNFNNSCTLPVTDYRFTLPIPLVETRVNPLVRAQQNPNY